MKNVTISLDDDTYRAARVYAAEHGSSISALVKAYLKDLASGTSAADVAERISGGREMPSTFVPSPATSGPPWLVAGKKVWTPNGKSRQPGAMRVAGAPAGDTSDAWPEDVLASFDAWDENDFDAVP
jgi:plasmid stability protein